MSIDNSNKKAGGDWDAALEEWDRSPLSPALAASGDKTPDAGSAAPAASETVRPPPSEADSSGPSTVRPPPSDPGVFSEEDDDDDRTVVGVVPAELIADSIRGLSSASGLGQIFGRAMQKTIPSQEETPFKDMDVFMDEEPSVVTSAPDFVMALKAPASDLAKKTTVTKASDDVADGEMFDPFADMRSELEIRPAKAPPLPRLGSSPDFGPGPSSSSPAKSVRSSSPDSTSILEPAPVSARDATGTGPKVFEPAERQFSQDDATAIFQTAEVTAAVVRAASEPRDRLKSASQFGVSVSEAPSTPQRPRSVAPPPPAHLKHQWNDERDTAAFLLDNNLRDAWEKRASWLAEEASSCEDPQAKRQLMMVVAELHAMLGNEEKSSDAACQLMDESPANPLQHRLARSSMLRDRQWIEMLAALDAETMVAPTADARVHGELLAAEILDRVSGDPDEAGKRFDQASRIRPGDPRAPIAKFTRLLRETFESAPKMTWPEAVELAPLVEAAELACRIREVGRRTQGGKLTAYEAISHAKDALARHDVSAAADALRALETVRGLGSGATWLGASLASQRPESRAQAIAWYRELLSSPHGTIARRLLGLRGVEAADKDAIDTALAQPGDASFSIADRVVLSALFDETPDPNTRIFQAVLADDETHLLGASAASALHTTSEQDAKARCAAVVGSSTSKAAVSLARSLAVGQKGVELTEKVEDLREVLVDSQLARLLAIECDIEAGRPQSIITEVSGWGGSTGANDDSDRDRGLASGLIAEVLDDKDVAQAEYGRAVSVDSRCEAAVRALGTLQPAGDQAKLVELARATSDESRSAVLLIEACLKEKVPGSEEFDANLRRSQELEPHLALASFLGERAARARGDIDGTLEWIRVRREASQDSIESAHDLMLEGMLLLERDPSLTASMMEKASSARPQDFALRDFAERFASEKPSDWVTWRIERAKELDGIEKGRLLLEAALDLERSGAVEEASKLALQSAEEGSSKLAQLCAERCEFAGGASSRVTDQLMAQARSEEASVKERREACERLAELDEFGRNDVASAHLWHRAILEESPSHLPSLRRLEQAYLSEGRDEDLEPIASELVKVLKGPEADAHAMVAARIRLRESPWSATKDLCELAALQVPASLWALRQSMSHALSSDENAVLISTAKALATRTDRESEVAALLIHAAHAYLALGQIEEAIGALQEACKREPLFFDAQLMLASCLEKGGYFERAAERLEETARRMHVREHRVETFYRAAILWLDQVKDADRGRLALEAACEIDITFKDVFERLQAIYIAASEGPELARLLERRLDVITEPEERVRMEVLRGKALADVGDIAAAKQALASALDSSPDDISALQAFVELCTSEQDWSDAEQALIRLVRLVPAPEEQASIYRRLGELYIEHLPNFERAEIVLLEVLKRKPDSVEAKLRLVDVYKETANSSKAIELCSELLAASSTPEEKRARTIQLAIIHEQVAGDAKQAEQILEKAYKETPSSVEVLRALAEFHNRQDHQPALKILLDRAANDARRSLTTGRFNTELFSVLEAVGELRGNNDAAQVARATLAAMDGEDVNIGGAALAACDPALDDIIAPKALSESFRALVKRAAGMLDTAFPMDLKALRAGPPPPSASQLQQGLQGAAAQLGLGPLEIFVSPALGPTCVPVSSSPARIVIGSSLLTESDDHVRDFLILRALKVIQTGATVLSRTAPIDLLPLLAALIKTFVPPFAAKEVDERRYEDARTKLKAVISGPVDPQLAALAFEVSSTIDNRVSMLNVAVNGWGDRAALLASGSIVSGVRAIALAGGHPSGPPASGKDRVTWIGRNAEARELVVFAVSEACSEARSKLRI